MRTQKVGVLTRPWCHGTVAYVLVRMFDRAGRLLPRTRRKENLRRAKITLRRQMITRDRLSTPAEPAAKQDVVARMTNWQRNQWARDGYPLDQAEDYAELLRPTPEMFAAAWLQAMTTIPPLALICGAPPPRAP